MKDLALLEELSLRLPELVSSTLSINSLREDLSIAHETVDRWINILESLYSIFLLPTFSHSRIKSLKKEKKHYLIDWTLVEDKGSKFENFIACHLLKWCKWMTDTEGDEYRLCFYRDREGREVDFIVTKNQRPIKFIEAKFSEKSASSSLIYLKKKYPDVECFQVIYSDKFHFTNKDGIEIIPARVFLKNH